MKKLIAIAIAALPAVAMADVTVYGTIAAGVEANHDFAVTTGAASSGGKVDSYGSKIGFKGTEDLGNGLKTIWQVESGISIDNNNTKNTNGAVQSGNTNTFATRDSFIGLNGDFGTVKMGRLSNFANTDSNIDAWGNNYVNGANGFSPTNPLSGFNAIARNQTRMNNAIEYRTPNNLSGFTGQAVYAMGETRTANTNGNPALLTGAYDLGLKYENSGYYGMATYTASQNVDPQGDSNWLWNIEGGYNADNLLVSALFQQSQVRFVNNGLIAAAAATGLSDNNINTLIINAVNAGSYTVGTNDAIKQNEAALTVGYTIGKFQPHFQYAHGWNAKIAGNTINNSAYDQYILGVNYELSKRTQAEVSYGLIQHKYQYSDLSVAGATGKANTQTLSVGLIHSF